MLSSHLRISDEFEVTLLLDSLSIRKPENRDLRIPHSLRWYREPKKFGGNVEFYFHFPHCRSFGLKFTLLYFELLREVLHYL